MISSGKKIFLFAGFLVILTAGLVLYFNQSSKPEENKTSGPKELAKSAFIQWMELSLKPGFLPGNLDVESGGKCHPLSSHCTVTKSDTFGAYWEVSGKQFYSEFKYNQEKGIADYYAIHIFYDGTEKLDENSARQLFLGYFRLPEGEIIFNCKQSAPAPAIDIDICGSSFEKNYKEDLLVAVTHVGEGAIEKPKDTDFVTISFLFRPQNSDLYAKENILNY